MCGIAAIISFTETGHKKLSSIEKATKQLAKRGPDGHGNFTHNHIAIGHRRLSIIDTSSNAGQPMFDNTGRYVIAFNGEFFNYKVHRNKLINDGIPLRNQSDTEVLLQLYIRDGEKCLEKINGFFAFIIYDTQTQKAFIARDRMGVKPLYIYEDDDNLILASELKAILAFGIEKEIDKAALFTYLQLNYIPAPQTIFERVRKVMPGHCISIDIERQQSIRHYTSALETPYYQIQRKETVTTYANAQIQLQELLTQSVAKRLIADVPIGAFLSGGIDSSIITAIAAQQTKNLNTFSIGFSDTPHFDETHYANLVAKKHHTNHTVFDVTQNSLFEILNDVLDYIDEPFADSSALNVFMLSKLTRQQVTVALSGDGADEMFAGYNKHKAEWMLRNQPYKTTLTNFGATLFKNIAGSRNTKAGNIIRQMHRMAEGSKLNIGNRYWRWCSMASTLQVEKLMPLSAVQFLKYSECKNMFTQPIGTNFNDVLLADMKLVLPNDMLYKVDMMSMANGLEVRTPFLDFELVDWAFTLPVGYKINNNRQKIILKDTFKNLLPDEIFNRGKKGFEVPLLNWFRTQLKSTIDSLLDDDFIKSQALFNSVEIQNLKTQMNSKNPGEIQGRIWALIVFQHWYKKYFT